MLAIMRRMENMDKRHTLHFQRWEERQKKGNSVYTSEDWEDKSWKEDEDDSSGRQKSNQKTETAQSKKPASSSRNSKKEKPNRKDKTPRSPPGFQRRKYVSQLHNSPFSDEILNAHFPQKLNLTELTKYDGTQDPTTHLEDFDMHMAVRGLEEPIVAWIFAATLKGPALKWLHTLPGGRSINLRT
ncbi:hypothetical protein K1719_039468 [Acacia pycnantha]|nr:hypothetical protein K1719_039468 [Acacia pycnantha]